MPQRRNGHPEEKARPSPERPINRLPGAARDAATTAGHLATDALHSAGQRADEMAATLGSTMQSLAGNLRTSVPGQEGFGPLAEGVADALDRTGQFLQEEGVSGLTREFDHLIRRNPLSSVLVAVGFGFFLAHLSRR